jgi:alkaline phosphatase D
VPYVLVLLVLVSSCQFVSKESGDFPQDDRSSAPGWASVFQTYTSSDQTVINVLRPRLTDLAYVVTEDLGSMDDFRYEPRQELKVLESVSGPHIHWKVDRLHIKNLDPQKSYRLIMVKKRWQTVADWRRFRTMDLSRPQTRFVVGSCMSDAHDFEHVRQLIWPKMQSLNPDFIMLLGDQVYVDDFDYVQREQANEFDIWTRYIDSFRKIPLFSGRDLTPILAVWDDHDFGTNNSDRFFKSKDAALKIFGAFFGGPSIPGVIDKQKQGVYFSFNGFGQKFLLMDNRYFREPDPQKPYGHWGQEQHQWFRQQLQKSKSPVWLANGGQFFTKATYVIQKKNQKKQINESFVDDHPVHYRALLQDIRSASSPVTFLSGDIHYSEIAKIEENLLGYTTYEITSSPIHSHIFRSSGPKEDWLDNPRRIRSVKEHNFLLVNSQAQTSGELDIQVQSYGVKQLAPYFTETMQVKKIK